VRQSRLGQPVEGQIRKVFERAMAGKTPQEIADELNAEEDTHDEWRDLNDSNNGCRAWTKTWTKPGLDPP
jgi:hypothetical protein